MMTSEMVTVDDDRTFAYGQHEEVWPALEEAFYLTNKAMHLVQTDREAFLWVANEALDLLARICQDR